jgi:hypothetical protein
MATVTPRRNRTSIINNNTRIGRLWDSVFPSTNKSAPEGTDVISITDAEGNYYYVTVNQLSAVLSSGQLASYLSSALPSASPAGQMIYISDLAVMAYSNGTNWVT